MKGQFAIGDIVEPRQSVPMPFKIPSRRGIVRFAYDHEPPASVVEFYCCGDSLGQHYLAEDEWNAAQYSVEL
jgi:hypothetical protein